MQWGGWVIKAHWQRTLALPDSSSAEHFRMPGSADGDRILPDWLWLKSLFSVEAPSDIPDPTEQGKQTGEP